MVDSAEVNYLPVFILFNAILDFIEQEMSHHQMYFNEYFGNIKVDLFQNFKVIPISWGWYSYFLCSGKWGHSRWMCSEWKSDSFNVGILLRNSRFDKSKWWFRSNSFSVQITNHRQFWWENFLLAVTLPWKGFIPVLRPLCCSSLPYIITVRWRYWGRFYFATASTPPFPSIFTSFTLFQTFCAHRLSSKITDVPLLVWYFALLSYNF